MMSLPPQILQHFDPTYDFPRGWARVVTEIEWPDGSRTVADAVAVDTSQLVDTHGPVAYRVSTQAMARAQAIIGRGR